MPLAPERETWDTRTMARKRKQSRKRRGAALRMPNVTLEKKIDFPWAPKKADPSKT